MRPEGVVVVRVFLDQIFKMFFTEYSKIIEALAFDRTDPRLGVRIQVWGFIRQFFDFDTVGFENLVEFFGEFRVPVPDEQFFCICLGFIAEEF